MDIEATLKKFEEAREDCATKSHLLEEAKRAAIVAEMAAEDALSDACLAIALDWLNRRMGAAGSVEQQQRLAARLGRLFCNGEVVGAHFDSQQSDEDLRRVNDEIDVISLEIFAEYLTGLGFRYDTCSRGQESIAARKFAGVGMPRALREFGCEIVGSKGNWGHLVPAVRDGLLAAKRIKINEEQNKRRTGYKWIFVGASKSKQLWREISGEFKPYGAQDDLFAVAA